MATTNLKSIIREGILYQTGNGTPNHTTTPNTIYTDLDTGNNFHSVNGSAWYPYVSESNISTTDTTSVVDNIVLEAGTSGNTIKTSSVSITSVQSAITMAHQHNNITYLDTINKDLSNAIITSDSATTIDNLVLEADTSGTTIKSSNVSITSVQSAITLAHQHSNITYLNTINQNMAVANDVEFNTTKSTALSSTELERGSDSKMGTGIPWDVRKNFKVTVSYSGGNVVATISLNSPYTNFTYYINNKKFTVTSSEIGAYSASTTASEGTYFFYINNNTTNVSTPNMVLTKTAWSIYDPDVLLWDFYFNSDDNTITWIGEERHTYGTDIYAHARNHAQGAIYKSGLLFSQYNGLTTFTNTNNNFGRAMVQISNGGFFGEDILNNINHYDAAITSTTTNPSTNWDRTVNQFLGFTEVATVGTNATTIVFQNAHTLVSGQAVTVMNGNTTTVRGTTTISSSGTGTTYTVTSVTGMASGDAIVIGARIPIYYIKTISGSNYTWRKLATTDFVGVSSSSAITAANIATAVPQYNNTTTGGFTNCTSVRHFPVYLMATNMTSEPIIAVMGQGQSTSATLATSLTEAPFQFQNIVGLSSLSIQEIVPFYRLTFEYGSTATYNLNRMRLVDATFLNVRVATTSGSVIGGSSQNLNASNITLSPPTNFSSTNVQDFTTEIKNYVDAVSFDTAIAGENLLQYDFVCLKSDGKIYRSNATTISTMSVVGKISSAYSSGDTATYQMSGKFTQASHGFTVGSASKIFASTTVGQGTNSAPATTDNIVQILGYAKDSTTIVLKISENYLTIA